VNEFITLICDCNCPAAPVLAFMKEAAPQFRCGLVCRSLSGCGVGQVNPFSVPCELILGAKVEMRAGHLSPLTV
jgi:hypothetical protein